MKLSTVPTLRGLYNTFLIPAVFLMLGSIPTAVFLFVKGVQERLALNIGLIVLAVSFT
uniref:Uncharacterized protein n=1 Tax=Trichobilharzia regenti TaxID=157069 RepID=A0AA85JDC4_TRIRE|nr:unnamed protein product [Trichobilharzia regenti]